MTRELCIGAKISGYAAVALSAAFSVSPAGSQPRPVISLDSAATVAEEQELFVRETAPNVTTVTRARFGQLFAALLPAKRYPDGGASADIVTSALGDRPLNLAEDESDPAPAEPAGSPDEPAGSSSEAAPSTAEPAASPGDTTAIPSDQDPNFARWQAEANRRQQEEDAQTKPKESPLAAQHPESYITVCEAGCRGQTNQIVYKIAKADAANAQPRGYKPTSAGADTDDRNASVVAKPANTNSKQAEALDLDTIDCVAGCYDGAKKLRARSDTAAATPEKHVGFAEATAVTSAAAAVVSAKVRSGQITRVGTKLDRKSHLTARHAKIPDATAVAAEIKKGGSSEKVTAVRAKTQTLARKTVSKPAWRTKLVRASEVIPAQGRWTTRVAGAAIDVASSRWKLKTTRYAKLSVTSRQR